MKKKNNFEQFGYTTKELIIWLCENARRKNKSANLRYANLRYADLRSADLRSADLRFANLQFANLQFADLRYADLRYADLRYADLRYANLRYANFDYTGLNLSCRGIGLGFDDRTIKQIMNHALKQYNKNKIYNEIRQAIIDNPLWYKWLEDWHKKDEVKDLKEFVISYSNQGIDEDGNNIGNCNK